MIMPATTATTATTPTTATTATTAAPAATQPAKGAAALTLDDLARRSYADLESLYRSAPSAATLRAIDGKPKGRMLAVRSVEQTPLAGPIRAFAASSSFVWDGKTFASLSDQEGTGINRVQIPGALGRQNLFPFRTLFGPSAIDGERTLILDYDLSENPPWIRKIHDEVREVAPGLFLGPAMWKAAGGPVTLLWFALDARGR
jgi:hypothetical protein